jgi:hypothetical protein
MLQLDIKQALSFLDQLDPGGRHTIASEAPFGGVDGGPKWERGQTHEAHESKWLIRDIEARQARGSNVYYGVNRPCSAPDQQGSHGKCNTDDIIAIRALAFDIDFTEKKTSRIADSLLEFVDQQLVGELRPSLAISTGGGYQLIYLLKDAIGVQLFRPAMNAEQEHENAQVTFNRKAITQLAKEFETLLRGQVPSSLPIKIDNMSNIDRVMRLPGTINYPKAEKIAKGQVPALAHIAVNYRVKCDIYALRSKVPRSMETLPAKRATPYVPRPTPQWPPYRKARACCQYICDNGLADTNEWYTFNVMLPLLGAMHDNELTVEEAEECFMLAISGGERYGTQGRGPGYFGRQWRSHLRSIRDGHRTLATLIYVCKEHGMTLPWSDAVLWEQDFERQRKELAELKQTISAEDMSYVKSQNH